MTEIENQLTRHEKLPHRAHQLVGVERLCERPFFFLADEVGAGKTKQVVDASQILFDRGKIDTVVVVTPAPFRSTWADPDPLLGEVAKHCWDETSNMVQEYSRERDEPEFEGGSLNWLVTNYEFIRRDDRLRDLVRLLQGRRTWLVLDESWAVKGNSDQMRACRTLRWKRADRFALLNGTPLADGKPEDLYYPVMMMDTGILGANNRAHFRAKYCVMGGYMGKQVVDYQNLDELNARVAPHVLSRRTRDCFDLPPMLPPVTIEARMSTATWNRYYVPMRDEMAAWLGSRASTASQAIVKALRLAQICAGYLGGLEDLGVAPAKKPLEPIPEWLRARTGAAQVDPGDWLAETVSRPDFKKVGETGTGAVAEIGRESLDAFLFWLDSLPQRPAKLLVWARFKPELERATLALRERYPDVYRIKGGQDSGAGRAEREMAKLVLAPGGDPRPCAVVGNQKAGGASLNLSAASVMAYLSQGPALLERTQSIGRMERPGQSSPMTVADVLVAGPKGQKTIVHHTVRSLRAKDDMARWTVNQWRRIIEEE